MTVFQTLSVLSIDDLFLFNIAKMLVMMTGADCR